MNWFVTIGGIAYNFVIIVLCSIFIFMRRKRQGLQEGDFLFGGRQMGWFGCAATLALATLGGGHINGLSAQSWVTGVATNFFCLGTGFFFILVCRYTGVWYRRMGCESVTDLFGMMFHPALMPILAGFGIGYSWMVLCVEVQGMAAVIASMTGLPNLVGGLIGAAIGMLYIILGGIEEIELVNSVNAVLMYVFGTIVLVFIGYNSLIGGWKPINDSLLLNDPVLLHALGNPVILRTYVIGAFVATALGMVFVQGDVQAAAAVPNVKVLRKACLAAIPLNVMFGVIIISMGLASKSLVDMNMLRAENGADGVVQLILNYMPNWLQVCVIGMFLAAMLSTFACMCLAVATMLNRSILNYFPPFKNMSTQKENALSRLWILIAGVSSAFAAVSIQAQTNFALTWGMAWFVPLFFVFVIGMKWKRSRTGILATLIICWVFNMVLTFTPLAETIGFDGNTYSVFMLVLSLLLGIIFTALDKNALPSYRQVYDEQRGKYDARIGADIGLRRS